MKKKIIFITFLFGFSALLLSFSGCRSSFSIHPAARSNPSDGSTAEDGSGNTGFTPDKATSGKGALTADTVILTINSSPVYWPEFYFWLTYIKKHYKKYHNLSAITDWNTRQNGMRLSDFFLASAVGYAGKDRAIEAKAKELDIRLTDKDLKEIAKRREQNIKTYGSTREYLHIINKMYVSEEVFLYLTRIDYLSNYLFKHFYGVKGEKCSDTDVAAYVRKKGYLCIKHIFLSNTGPDGNALSQKSRIEKYKLMESIHARLKKSDSPLTLFDALADEYSEDLSASRYPYGRLFIRGSMGAELENTYSQLRENTFSDIVITGDGYYIILRIPVTPDMITDSTGNTLRYLTAYDYLFRNQIEEWPGKMEITYEDAYYTINVQELPE